MSLNNIYDVVEEQRRQVLKRESQTISRLVQAYEYAEREIINALERITKKIEDAQDAGTPISPYWLNEQARLGQVLFEIENEIKNFTIQAISESNSLRRELLEQGIIDGIRLGEMTVSGDFAGFNRQTFRDAQAFLSDNSPLKALFDEISPTAVDDVKQIFAEAIVSGYNPRKVARIMRRRIETMSLNRATNISRTEGIRAYRTGNTMIFKQNGDVLRGWRWTAAKTPATCAMCLALDGEIFPYWVVMESHNQCRCSETPLPRTEFPDSKASFTDAEEYFKKLPEDKKRKILGKRKLELYNQGKFKLKDNVVWHDHPVWGKSPRARRVGELEELIEQKKLPSQLGQNLSSYVPPKPTPLIGVESPTSKANRVLESKTYRPEMKEGVKNEITKADRKVKPTQKNSEMMEVGIKDVYSGGLTVQKKSIRKYVDNLGDGKDLPVLIRKNGRLYVYDNNSLARIEAKRLLGKTRFTGRIIDMMFLLLLALGEKEEE